MRPAKLLAVMLIMAAVALAATPGTFGQPPRWKKKKDGFNPVALFDNFAKGKDVIHLDELPIDAEIIRSYAKLQNINNGVMDREQFVEFFEWFRQNGFNEKFPTFNPRRSPFRKDAAELEFKRMDINGDGLLNNDEMPDRLKQHLARWDTNKDGLIDLEEFKKFYQTRMEEAFGLRKVGPILEEWEKRPLVMRVENLRDDLPDWFEQFDTDGDGQISLAEWLQGGKPLEEFAKYDRNDDGFLTPAEVLRIEPVIREIIGKDGPAVDNIGKRDALKKFSGTLTADDPPHADPMMRGLRHKAFEVQFEKGKKYRIHLNSTDFDSFLGLQAPSGEILAVDDDGGGNLNSRIDFSATVTGTYRLIATSLGSRPGAFQLIVMRWR